jgi:hypothetical protein
LQGLPGPQEFIRWMAGMDKSGLRGKKRSKA